MKRTVTAGILSALLALPGVALASGKSSSHAAAPATTNVVPTVNPNSPNNPFSPGVPQSPAQTPSTTTPIIANPTTTTASGSGLSGSSGVAIGIGAVIVLTGISFFIWRDARRRAPVRQRAAVAGGPGGNGRTGSKQRAKPRKLSPAERRRRKRGRAR